MLLFFSAFYFRLPAASNRKVARLSERPETAVYPASIPDPVAVEVEFPEPGIGIKDANFCHPRSIPVSDYRQVSWIAKGSQTAVYPASIPDPVAVEVEFPEPGIGIKDAN